MAQFSRCEMLIGKEAIDVLKNAHVVLLGLGGVGSYTAEALARAGIGKLTLIDNDAVSITNINRQLYALHSTVGKLKTTVAAQRIHDINPKCTVNELAEFYLPEKRNLILDLKPDYIADAIDTMSAKIDLAVLSEEYGIPLISCMGTGNKFCPEMFETADIYQTSVCPVCRIMRRELKARGVKRLRVVYSKELPAVPQTGCEATNKRQTPGSMSFVPPVAGMIMAGEIIKVLLKKSGFNV